MVLIKKYFWVILFFIFVGSIALGHSAGQSLEKQINDYFIDVGYSAVDKIYTDEAIRFDFNLWNEDKSNIADFDHVWVRITPQEEGIDFAGFLYRPNFLLTGMSYTFQKAGQYELTVRFLDKDDKNLAEATFPLSVESGESEKAIPFREISFGASGLFIGFSISFTLFKRSSKPLQRS